MGSNRKKLEREFESMLVAVLEQDHDLEVRRSGDQFDRRRDNVATLHFKYQHEAESRAKVVVTVEGLENASHILPVDFSDPDAIERSAEDCEALALSIFSFLQERGELGAMRRNASACAGLERRWDD